MKTFFSFFGALFKGMFDSLIMPFLPQFAEIGGYTLLLMFIDNASFGKALAAGVTIFFFLRWIGFMLKLNKSK